MTDTELAWLAGYLEGEGCFFIGKSGPCRPDSKRITCSVVSTDADVIAKAAELMGTHVANPTRKTVSGKPVYTAWLHGSKAVELMKILLPFMGHRRAAKIKEIIIASKKRPGCPWGEFHGQSKLTVEKVIELRLLAQNNPPRGWQANLARKWGISHACLGYALRGRSWKKATLTAIKVA